MNNDTANIGNAAEQIMHTCTAVLVAGMHRSGTSATTRILNLLGAKLPSNLMQAHSDFNPSGFWESTDVTQLNDRLLAAANSAWDDVLPIDPEILQQADIDLFQSGIGEIFNRDFRDCDLFAIKDPRIGKLLRFWIPALAQWNVTSKIIIPVRHPLEVAASLARREGFTEEKSIYLWLRHLVDTLHECHEIPFSVLPYDELIKDWRPCMERVERDINVKWPVDIESAATAIAQFMDPKLRHHEVTTNLHSRGKLGQMAADLYSALLTRANDLPAIAESIRLDLRSIENVIAPILHDFNQKRAQERVEKQALNDRLTEMHGAFEIKSRNTQQLEELLTSERATFRHLENEFNTKCSHIKIQHTEILELKNHIRQLQKQRADYDANRSNIGALEVGSIGQIDDLLIMQETYIGKMSALTDELNSIENFIISEQFELNQYREQKIQIENQQREFSNEIVRAEAQLALLKDLLLNG